MLTSSRLIGDKYELLDEVGQGGMGAVWRARHRTLGRAVAIKFVRAGLESPSLVARFLREALLTATIRHRNVVDVLDFGATEEGLPYLVMELLEGEGLGERLGRLPPLAVGEVIEIVTCALGGLAAAHDAGVIHRDLKPENIFLSRDADGIVPKLVDFGIARAAPTGLHAAVQRGLTDPGTITGTPHYMSPEQVCAPADLDARSDLYSMGVILYEALTGRLPFDGASMGELLFSIVERQPVPVASLCPLLGGRVSAAVERALAKKPADRFADAREMRRALAEAAADLAAEAIAPAGRVLVSPAHRAPHASLDTTASAVTTPLAIESRSPAPAARRPLRSLALAAAGVLLAAFAASFLLWLPGDGRRGTEPPAPARQGSTSPPTAGTTTADAAPAAVPARRPVFVQLVNVPDHAVVRLNGGVVTGSRIEIARDGREHAIEVEVPSGMRWRVSHVADADGTYTVQISDTASTRRSRAKRMKSPRPRPRPFDMVDDPGF